MNDVIPDRFDIVFMDMDPKSGTEIRKRRPCLVLSNKKFNQISTKAFICPITNTPSRSAAQIEFSQVKIKGTILVDQLRSLDWRSRKAQKIDELKDYGVYDRICQIVNAIIIRLE